MKTNALKQMGRIFLLISLFVLASCSDNDAPVVLTDPAEMCEPNLTFKGDDLSLQINGTPFTDGYVYFEPIEEDSTQMMMHLVNYIHTQSIRILVKTTPGEGFVTFESTQDYYINYKAQLKGTYQAEANGVSRQVQAEGIITPYYVNTEPTEYLFDEKNVFSIEVWQGSRDFVQAVLDKISQRIAKEITGVKLQFHDDTTFDMWLKRAGQTDYELWMTARYWISEYTNSMSWFFTPEQCEQFCTQWLGAPLPSPYGKSPFRRWENYYELPITYWNATVGFAWTIANPNRYTALDMFMQGKGTEGLTEEEKQEMEKFSQVLYDVDDLSHWMSWCIVLRPSQSRPSSNP